MKAFSSCLIPKENIWAEVISYGNLPQPTYIEVVEDRQVVRIISPIPAKMPEDKIVDAALGVAAINSQLLMGYFRLDISNGSISFVMTESYRGMDTIDNELIQYLLGTTFFTTDEYNDKFFMLGKGMMTFEQFIEKINEE